MASYTMKLQTKNGYCRIVAMAVNMTVAKRLCEKTAEGELARVANTKGCHTIYVM